MTTNRATRLLLATVLGVYLVVMPRAVQPGAVAAATLTFVVTSTADAPDATPGDGVCASTLPGGACTLRAAVEEADAQPSGSAVVVDLPAGTYGLTLGTLRLTANSITISGALSSTTIISGNNSATVVSISSAARATLTRLTLTGGNAGSDNGGGLLNQGIAVLRQSAVVGNTATAGGGIANMPGARLWLDTSSVRDNTAHRTPRHHDGRGGGIANSGILTVTTSTFDGNVAGTEGGGIENHDGTLTLTDSTLSANSAQTGGGGGIVNSGTMTLADCALTGNSAHDDGGGIYNSYSTMSVTNCTLTANSTSQGPGGGMANSGILTITTSTLSGNSTGTYGGGGGIDNFVGTLTLIDSTLSGNVAGTGGGISNNSGAVTLVNSTLSANSAQNGPGGGIDNLAGTITLTNSTLGGNSAQSGGGIANESHDILTLRGTIVATSAGGADCSLLVPLADSGYNLDSDGSCGFTQPTDITATNPLLGPLAANGGPTQTLALLPGSPAIDHGGTHASGCPATDQRGRPRPDEARDGGACDMGAYESQGVQ